MASGAFDLDAWDDVFKELYPYGLKEDLYDTCRAYGWMKKDQKFGSDVQSVAIKISGIRGSNQFSTALQNRSTSIQKKFLVTRVRTYALATLDGEAMMASEKDSYALASILSSATKSATYEVQKAVGHQLYTNSGGHRGKGDSAWTVSSQTIVLSEPWDAFYFEPGDKIVASTTDGTSGSVKAGTLTVDTVDVETGTITVVESAANVGIPTIANTDYLFREGDFGTCLTGLPAWLPATVSGSDSFFSVNRSAHRQRLAGHYLSHTGLKEDGVLRLATQIATMTSMRGAKDYAFICHPMVEAEIIAGLHARMETEVNTDIAGLFYNAVTMKTPLGTIPILSDPYCRRNTGYILNKRACRISSLGEHPHFVRNEGGSGKLIVEPAEDGVGFRLRAYHQFIMDDPSACGRIDFA